MANAPVCNIVIKAPPGSPNLPSLQPIPKATDLPSAFKAIQALTNNFNTLQSGLTNGNANFIEDRPSRVTQIVRIFNPNDSAQFVDVAQIVRLVFVDAISGQTLTFQRS